MMHYLCADLHGDYAHARPALKALMSFFAASITLVFFLMPNRVVAQDVFSDYGIKTLRSSQSELVLEYCPQVSGYDTVKSAGKLFILPRIKGAQMVATKPGAPYTLQMVIPVVVPSSTGFRLENVAASAVKQFQGTMLPQPILKRVDGLAVSSYQMDDAAYNHTLLADWCTAQYIGVSRDRNVARLTIAAARYDAASGAIQIPTKIHITLSFQPDGAIEEFPAFVSDNDDFTIGINQQQTKGWRISPEAAQKVQAASAWVVTAKGSGASNGSSIQSASPNPPGMIQAASRWIKIKVDEEGMYRITAQDLANKGITLSAQDVSTIKIFGTGGKELSEKVSDAAANAPVEQPIIVDTTADGKLNEIRFYAAASSGWVREGGEIRHFINTYTYTSAKKKFSTYMLSVGGTRGRRVSFAETPNDVVVTLRPQSYTARAFWEDEVYNPYKEPSGRRWFGSRVINNSPQTQSPILLPNLVKTGTVMYRICAGVYNADGYYGGILSVTESTVKAPLMQFVTYGTGYTYASANFTTQTKIISASTFTDRTTLQFSFNTNSTGDDGAVDWYEVHYPREFVPVDNQLDFFTEAPTSTPAGTSVVAQYSINNFSSGSNTISPYIVDVTNRTQPVFVRNESSAPTTQVSFRTVFTPANPKRFVVSGQLRTPTLESVDDASAPALRANPANVDVVVVTHKDLLTSAREYKKYREAQSGLSVLVVTTEQLYNEFAGGMPDATAVRDFMADAYANWATKPRYLVLWGDGHYDVRGIRTTAPVYVPTYQSLDPDGDFDAVNVSYMTEDYFARITGNDDIVDVALGRLPLHVNSSGVDEGTAMLAKIKQYETNSSRDIWRSRITLVADDSPTSDGYNGAEHTNNSEQLARTAIPSDMRQQKIYLVDYPTEFDSGNRTGGRKKPGVNQDIITAANNGSVLLNWVGHGNPQLWAHEQVFTNSTSIPQLKNFDRLFFLTAATCDYSRFDEPDKQCGSELLVLSPIGGAIGVFAATRTVYSNENAAINQAFYTNLFAPQANGNTRRLGDVMYALKQYYTGHNDIKYCLLGDPTMRLLIPQQSSRITRINGINIEQSGTVQPQIKALSTAEISGKVFALDRFTLDNTFNGNVVLSLFDTDIQKADVDVDQSIHDFVINGGLLNFGSAKVLNGEFTAKIVIPKDISFSNQSGRLYVYAVDTTRADKVARGVSVQFTVGGTDESVADDGKGPDISIFLENRKFRAGDYVSSKPTLIADLFDQTGLNATGSGIGHDIEYWLDANPLPSNLTSSFNSSIEDSRRGNVQKQLGTLSSGSHRIRVRAWDVFNNFSEAETYFRVASDGAAPVVVETMNYPNPVQDATTIQFRHTVQTESIPVSVSIYSINGSVVRTISTYSDARTVELRWDGRDAVGKRVSPGIYIYRVSVTGGDGVTASTTGKMVVSQ